MTRSPDRAVRPGDRGPADEPPRRPGSPPPRPFGPRLPWADLPDPVRAQVEQVLGAPVVTAIDQRGGFSPGVAARVATGTGRTAFLKACSTMLNPGSVRLFAREARVLGILPARAGAPRLAGHYELQVGNAQWGLLMTEDIEGRQPRTPWIPEELAAACTAYHRLATTPLPADLDLPTLQDALGWETTLMAKVAADPPAELHPWVRRHAEDLAALAAAAPAALAGDALVHLDARSDNLLLTPSGTIRIVDWPWACVGAPWMDLLSLALNVKIYDPGADVRAVLEAAGDLGGTTEEIDAVLAALTGYFWHAATQPAVEGLPTLRPFQLAQARALSTWLAARLRW